MCSMNNYFARPEAQLVERWTAGGETLRRSIYETPYVDDPVGGSSRGQSKSVECDGPCPSLTGTLNCRLQILPITLNIPIGRYVPGPAQQALLSVGSDSSIPSIYSFELN